MNQELRKKQCLGFLNTPPLWLNEQFSLQQFEFPNVSLHDFNPKPIPSKIRLGHQMEYVFKQLIAYCDEYDVLLHNLPIKQGKRTIGEIDFILKELKTQKIIHVELTYKFYIINTKISEPIHQLMGPNKRDMFFTKMEKIKNDQFRLLHTPEGISALTDTNLDHTQIEHQTCYKAQIFKAYGSESIHIRPLNKACIAGYWLHLDDFNTDVFKRNQFYIPYKSEWVIAPHEQVSWSSHFETLMEINLRLLKENAPMVWMRNDEDEFEKFFVVWWK